MPLRPDDATVERFRRSLADLLPASELDGLRLGVAVSGGPDSVALLLLAAAAFPGAVEAATVDHGFRAESADEARQVAALCDRLGVRHEVLTVDWTPPASNRQALGRDARYASLGAWMARRRLGLLATGHHGDDQAETLMMRWHRGAGLAGLTGIRPARPLNEGGDDRRLVRPLLGWRKAELVQLLDALGVGAASDPSNADPAHDRTSARQWLDMSPSWPDRGRMAASARHLAEAEQALDWAAERLFAERAEVAGPSCRIDMGDVPPELVRRLALRAFAALGLAPRGDRLDRALRLAQAGRTVTVGGAVIRPETSSWRIALAPPRRA